MSHDFAPKRPPTRTVPTISPGATTILATTRAMRVLRADETFNPMQKPPMEAISTGGFFILCTSRKSQLLGCKPCS